MSLHWFVYSGICLAALVGTGCLAVCCCWAVSKSVFEDGVPTVQRSSPSASLLSPSMLFNLGAAPVMVSPVLSMKDPGGTSIEMPHWLDQKPVRSAMKTPGTRERQASKLVTIVE